MFLQHRHFTGQAGRQAGQQNLPYRAGPALVRAPAGHLVCCRRHGGIFHVASAVLEQLPWHTLCSTCSLGRLSECRMATLETSLVLLCMRGAVAVLRSCTAVSEITVDCCCGRQAHPAS